MIKKYFCFIFVISALYVFPPKNVNADLGPKPDVYIDVVYNQQKIPDSSFSAKMLGCLQQDIKYDDYPEDIIPQLKIKEYDSSTGCYWYPDRFAWGGQCSNSSCYFTYSPPNRFKLAIFVPSINKVFITNEISGIYFSERYHTELFSDGSAKISNTPPPILSSDKISAFVKSFLITIILELLVSIAFIFAKKLSKKILAYVLLANIISLPIVWFLFPLIKLPVLNIIVISEIFAVLFESYFIYFLGKQVITLKQSVLLCVLNNLVSLFIGGFIYILLQNFLV